RKDNIYIFETTLGRGRVKQGDRVAIYTSEIERNPLTKQKEISEWVVTNGIVSEHCGSSKSWILVKERGADVRLGDYIKVNYKKGIFDAIKGAGSALNAILE
ncbi:MAG: hypothetical protein GWP10_11835, partial [Nitrospiraceae bacterium]|nr:hypothetical protein [Nitrospiraceae bacterium]